MLITRKTEVPKTWAFYAQLVIILSIYGQFVVNAPFLLLIKKFIDNPAAIMGLISLQIWVTFMIGPLVAWLSDRIWTKFGRRKMFVASADFLKVFFLLGMPFAPNLWVLILLRWGYDFFGDLAAPAQALINEIVPAKQRGISSGFMKAFMNIGNLVFFTLLLGRFDDIYFMGPFQFFTTVDGGTIMFILCALLFFGAAIFEAIGIKEVYPPGRKRLRDGRKPGENIFVHFVRSVFGDIFAKDLLPLYLLLVGNIMFGFGLGMFQPLLFTEQWGYDLQTFGNTIAIGVPLGIVLGLVGGWMADKFGKMTIVFWATIGNLVVNIAYTAFVYYQPDYRPSFWEIVAFGNAAYIFGGIKGVASGPLLWEYVARNRMGGATAGIMVFNSLIRNSIGVVVGGWLFLWSLWFLPQAGYNITATFKGEFDEETVAAQVEAAGLDLSSMKIRPVHQYGVDGETSLRWWIHQEDREAQKLIDEREDLQNEIDNLENDKSFVLTPEERKVEIEAEILVALARMEEIEADLEERSRDLEAKLQEVLASLRFVPGEQLWGATFEEGQLTLKMQTIEAVTEDNMSSLLDNLRGQELLTRVQKDEKGRDRKVPDITLTPLTERLPEAHGLEVEAAIDLRFYDIFEGAYEAGLSGQEAFDLASATMAVSSSQFTTRQSDFRVEEVVSTVAVEEALPSVRFTLLTEDTTGERLPAAAVQEIYNGAARMIERVSVEEVSGGYALTMLLQPNGESEASLPYSETAPRMAELLGADDARKAFAMAMFRKLAETLAAPPVYVTVPQNAIVADYADREYEYFFSSQLLQIGTDFFGIGILLLIIYLEKRGTLHRYGAEEDKNR